MDAATKQMKHSTKSGRKPKGTFPPILKLSEAIVLAAKVSEQAGGSATYDTFSQVVGNSTKSSAFQRKVAALRAFGIAEDLDNIVKLSSLGVRIAAPASPEDAATAKKEAMLRVDTLSRVYERFKGKLLPDDQFAKNIVTNELSVQREVADDWLAWFKDAAAASNLLHVRSDGKTQILESPGGLSVNTATAPDEARRAAAAPLAAAPTARGAGAPALEHVIPISLGLGKLVRVELPENWDAKKDLRRLLKMLELSLADDADYMADAASTAMRDEAS